MCGLRLLRSYICFATSQISLLTKQTLFFRLFVFCSFAPSPHGYTVSRGVPKIPKKSEFLDSNSLKTARNFSLKSQNFDGFLGFFVGSENPSVRVAHCTFEITLSGTITLTLLLVCAFSPKVQKYLLGSPLTDFQVLGKTQKGANCRRFYHLLWTFSAKPIISFTSITVPSSRIALPLNLPNT